ncbi:MAG: helix-turn-helix domain-containing protein [Deltaproteobacteria bacterium]|nr:MAG: helix-turn-helix domain-containing protein [Deltaproteobacteria bacterium]
MRAPWGSVDDVARCLGVSRDTVCRWTEARGMPPHKVGGLWKFKLGAVGDWMRDGGACSDDADRTGES